MKSFITKILIFFVPILAITFVLFKKAGGYTDEFYLRFTSPKQSSLILGTSRAAQGLQPSVFNEALGRTDIYNYSFTIAHSPYGPVYLESIKRKLDASAKDGIFILSVDPWSISSPEGDFREKDLALGRMKVVNMDPNPFYLIEMYRHPFYKLFQKSGEMFLHDDGWLEVSVPMDSVTMNERIKAKVEEYKITHLPTYMPSTRIQYLEETISFLKQHGEVYLVRLPVHKEILELDNFLEPGFNSLIGKLSVTHDVPYLDMTGSSNQYQYTDGNHLYKDSGKEVSRFIATWISRQRQKD